MEENNYNKALLKKTLPNPTFFDYLSYIDLKGNPDRKKDFEGRMNKALDMIYNSFNSGKDSYEPFTVKRRQKPSIA